MKVHVQGGPLNKGGPPDEWVKFYNNPTWTVSYLKGLMSMLDSVHTGRRVHEIANIKQGILSCLSLIDRGKDPSAWCKKHLPSLSNRTKKIYREWLELNPKREEYFDG